MEPLIFQTNIDSEEKVQSLESILNNHPDIFKWSIDIEDIDNVFRIEGSKNLLEKNIIDLIKSQNFQIEILPDEAVIKADKVLVY
ncbi:hypothetical protein [Tenacibaculum aiptasiae]|uniref:hypothetical protein n=1 Tax=Tenacibaculum aiptasiae TaxID=426481 RepID=UPI00232B4DAB|nr:hypothetical protein [Tenacibaculum aiptasiae]